MGKPRFRPASICVNPREFGRKPRPIWEKSPNLGPREVAWALYQHHAALATNQALAARGQEISDLATLLEEDPAWLRRKLYGQVPADLGDILAWALELGIDILPDASSAGYFKV